ncbi:MFS transporter [Falsihalocynthiibacter sp. S25ZX9]|uniref:MFS transporter n=1 Tax=Falsihalocynthiibacter sp. S25ZX9 TaxID=3240870 RepID=UPI0035103D1F
MSRVERLSLYIALTALTAFAIDGVLPVMPIIESAFDAESSFSGAQIITAFVLGMAAGELLIGPISDAFGRRPAVISGLVVFVIGTVVAATAESFSAVIFGRFLQGIGVAGPKIGTRAMIRDRYEGADMARIMSVIFTLLILVPMIAPTLGALIAAAAGWRGVFWSYLMLAAGMGAWLWLRHPETLHFEKRVPLSPRRLWRNIRKMLFRIDVMPIVIATGFVFGAQLTYFAVAANLFGAVYGVSAMMPVFFALLATGTALALVFNVWLVGRTGMEVPIFAGLMVLGLSGTGLLIAAVICGGHPPLVFLLGLTWFLCPRPFVRQPQCVCYAPARRLGGSRVVHHCFRFQSSGICLCDCCRNGRCRSGLGPRVGVHPCRPPLRVLHLTRNSGWVSKAVFSNYAQPEVTQRTMPDQFGSKALIDQMAVAACSDERGGSWRTWNDRE